MVLDVLMLILGKLVFVLM